MASICLACGETPVSGSPTDIGVCAVGVVSGRYVTPGSDNSDVLRGTMDTPNPVATRLMSE